MANIKKNRQRWEKMDLNDIPIPSLVDHYIITCRTEGKTPATLLGYREKFRRFIKWSEDATLADFSVEMVREYICGSPVGRSWIRVPDSAYSVGR